MPPTFFVIGAAKSGTTSLHRYLDLHPMIQMSRIKEPNYFAPQSRHFKVRRRVAGRADYEALFDPNMPCRGESSHTYSEYPRHPHVPARIREAVPDAKLIYLVRDPLERVRSLYVQTLSSGWPERPTEPNAPIAEVIGDLADPENEYVCSGLYMTQIERFLAVFPPSSLLIVDQADLLRAKMETLAQIHEFVGAKPSSEVAPGSTLTQQHNESVKKRHFRGAYVRLSNSPLKEAFDRTPAGVRAPLVRIAQRSLSRPMQPSPMGERLRHELTEIFTPEVKALREFTGRLFPTWSI